MIHFRHSIILLFWIYIIGLYLVATSSLMRYPGLPVMLDFRTSNNGGFTFFSSNEENKNEIDSSQVSSIISKAVPLEKIKHKKQKKDAPLVKMFSKNAKSLRTTKNMFRTAIPVNENEGWQSMKFFTSDQFKGTPHTKPIIKNNVKHLKVKKENLILKKDREDDKAEKAQKIKSHQLTKASDINRLGIKNRRFDDWSNYLLGHFNWITTSGKTNYDVSLDKYPIIPNMIIDNSNEIWTTNQNEKSAKDSKAMDKSKLFTKTQSQVAQNFNTKKTSSEHSVNDKSKLDTELEIRVSTKNTKSESKSGDIDKKNERNVKMIKTNRIKPQAKKTMKSLVNVKLRETKPVIPVIPKTLAKVNASKENQKPIKTGKSTGFNSFRFSPLQEIKPIQPVVPKNVEKFGDSFTSPKPIHFRTINGGLSIINSPLREISPVKPFIPNKSNVLANNPAVETLSTQKIRERNSIPPAPVPGVASKILNSISDTNNIVEKNLEKLKPVQEIAFVKNNSETVPNENLKNEPIRLRVYLSQLTNSPLNNHHHNHHHENHTKDEQSHSFSDLNAKESKSKGQNQVNKNRKKPTSWRSRLQSLVKMNNPSESVIETKLPVSPAKVITHKRVWPSFESPRQEVKRLNVIIHDNNPRFKNSKIVSNSIHVSNSRKTSIPIPHTDPVLNKLGKQTPIKGSKIFPQKSWRSVLNKRRIKRPKSHLDSSKIMWSNLRLGDILSSSFPERTILIPNNQDVSGINKIRNHKHKKSKLEVKSKSKSKSKKVHNDGFASASRKSFRKTDQLVDLSTNSFLANDNPVDNSRPNNNVNDNTPSFDNTFDDTQSYDNTINNTSSYDNTINKMRPTRKYLSEILEFDANRQTYLEDASQKDFHDVTLSADNTVTDSPTTLLPETSVITYLPTTPYPVTRNQLDTTTGNVADYLSSENSNYDTVKIENPKFKTITPPLKADDRTNSASGIHSSTGSGSSNLQILERQHNSGSNKVSGLMNPFGLTLFDANMKPLTLEDMLKILQEENIVV